MPEELPFGGRLKKRKITRSLVLATLLRLILSMTSQVAL